LALAKSKGCGEALMANTRGEVCEGTGSNVFLVLRGRLVTPPLSSGCLPGITRSLVIKACQSSGIDCHEEPVPVSALDHCEEAFLTSSTRGVHPVAELDGRLLPTPGALTQSVEAVFHQLAADLVR